MADLEAYNRASERLLGLIQREDRLSRAAPSRARRAETRLSRTRDLLRMFGDPQRRYPIVHVTGTSGKGSTSTAIAAILTAAGYQVGLRTSPYLQVAIEKLQLGPRLIDPESLDRVSAQVIETHRLHVSPAYPGQRLGYSEAWSALTLLWFAEQQVDVAVIEVGAGGRFDATNVINPVASVITSVGLDHVDSLGPTIADIAWHKAGIIKPGATAVVGDVPREAWLVIQLEADLAGARLVRSKSLPLTRAGLAAMPGAFQQANAEVAVAAISALRDLGFPVADSAIAAGLATARLPGRLERMPGAENPIVWIDGAHNADKIAALAREAMRVSGGGPLPIVVLGVLNAKDAPAIAAGLGPMATAIVATEPTVIGRRSLPALDLASAVQASGYGGILLTEPNPIDALLHAESMARNQGSNVLVTGSLYLAGQLRRRWYPDAQIVLQRTPWPEPRTEFQSDAF